MEQLAKEQKYGVLDLDVELESGEIVNIEMQMEDHKNMEKRTTYYASKKITELPEYVTKTVRVADQHRDYELNNNVTYYYIELEKFREQNPDMTLPINQWLAFIDMEKGELLEMAEKENKLIKEAKGHYDTLTGDAEVKRLAEIRFLSQMEEQATLETARDRGLKKGWNKDTRLAESKARRLAESRAKKMKKFEQQKTYKIENAYRKNKRNYRIK